MTTSDFRAPALRMAVLLAVGALALLALIAGPLREEARHERLVAARVVMESIAATLERALTLGVPLDRVVGLDELVESRVGAGIGLAAMTLLDADGRQLWQRASQAEASAPATLEVPVGRGGAILRASLDEHAHWPMLARLGSVLLLVAASLGLPLVALARYVDLLRARFARRLLARQVDALRRDDFSVVWRPAAQTGGDPRLRRLRHEIHLLNERYQRVVRLLDSLRRTEPDADKRAALSALRARLESRYHFASQGSPLERAIWPAGATVRAFALSAVLLANLGQWLTPGIGGQVEYLLAALSVLALGMVVGAWRAPAEPARALLAALCMSALACALAAGGGGVMALGGRLAAGVALAWAFTAMRGVDRLEDMAPASAAEQAMLVLAAVVAGPLLGLAVVESLGMRWLAVGSVLGLGGALALFLILPDGDVAFPAPSPSPVRHPRLAAWLAGAAWSAGLALLLILIPGQPGQREPGGTVVLLIAAQAPLLLLLSLRRGLAWLAVVLLASAVLVLVLALGLPRAPLLALGLAGLAGAAYLPLPRGLSPAPGWVGGGGLAVFGSLWGARMLQPEWAEALALAWLLGALLLAPITRRPG